MTTSPGTRHRTDARGQAIAEARRLFVENGYAAFSMRKVARALGISQGHLQHYFPSRDDLLTAMLEQTAGGYMETYRHMLASPKGDARIKFDAVVAYLLNDLSNHEINDFFLELWPLANRDPSIAAMLSGLYARNLEVFSQVVAGVRPDLSATDLVDCSLQILALVDGLLVYGKSVHPDDATLSRAKRNARQAIETMVGLSPMMDQDHEHPAMPLPSGALAE